MSHPENDRFMEDVYENNLAALARFEETLGPVKDYMIKNASDGVNYLRSICGYRCVGCGGQITLGSLNYNDYGPDTKCWDCLKK